MKSYIASNYQYIITIPKTRKARKPNIYKQE